MFRHRLQQRIVVLGLEGAIILRMMYRRNCEWCRDGRPAVSTQATISICCILISIGIFCSKNLMTWFFDLQSNMRLLFWIGICDTDHTGQAIWLRRSSIVIAWFITAIQNRGTQTSRYRISRNGFKTLFFSKNLLYNSFQFSNNQCHYFKPSGFVCL